MKIAISNQAKALAEKLGLPAEVVIEMVIAHGVDAIERHVREQDGITMPLRLWVEEIRPSESQQEVSSVLPVFLPRGMVELLVETVGKAAGYPGAHAGLIEDVFSSSIESALEDCRDGLSDLAVHDDSRKEEIIDAVGRALERWEMIDGTFRRKGGGTLTSALPSVSAMLPIFLPSGMVTLLRAIIEETAECTGGLEAYVEEHLANELRESLTRPRDGLISLITDLYEFGDDHERIEAAMRAEIGKWEYADGKFQLKEAAA